MLATSVLALALAAPAQDPPKAKPAELRFGTPANSLYYWPVNVLTSPDVQKELKITKEQLAKLETVRAELDKRVQKGFTLPIAKMDAYYMELGGWADKQLAALVTAEQLPRYRQIVWQAMEHVDRVPGMAANPAFAQAIGMSAEQLKRAQKVRADATAAYMRLARANPGGNAIPPGGDKVLADADAAVLKLLTAEQKKAWNDQLGEPFQGTIYFIPGVPPFKAPARK